MGIETQGARPSGVIGRLAGTLMNRLHAGVYAWFLDGRLPADGSRILDIGCGGGAFLKYLSQENRTYKLHGVDHSAEMVALSRRVNRRDVEAGRLVIMEASVASMPIENETVDLATAFDTVQFWPDLERSLAEVRRTLKSGASFLIVNRYPREGTAWWRRAQMKSDRDYADRLRNAGFRDIRTDLDRRRGWIVATATK